MIDNGRYNFELTDTMSWWNTSHGCQMYCRNSAHPKELGEALYQFLRIPIADLKYRYYTSIEEDMEPADLRKLQEETDDKLFHMIQNLPLDELELTVNHTYDLETAALRAAITHKSNEELQS